METSTLNEDTIPSTQATTAATTVPATQEPEKQTTAPTTLCCALTRFGSAKFRSLAPGDYLVSVACSHHQQVVTVSGKALYERLQPLSSRDTVQALIRISEGEPLSIGISAPDKVPTDGLLVKVEPVNFIS